MNLKKKMLFCGLTLTPPPLSRYSVKHICATLFAGLFAALLIAPSVAQAVPVFSARLDAAITGTSTCTSLPSPISNSSNPANLQVVCTENYGTLSAGASATYGSVGAEAHVITSTATSVAFGIKGSATFADTLTFSKTSTALPDQFLVSLNLVFDGILNAAHIPGGDAGAGLGLGVSFPTLHSLDVSFNPGSGLNILNPGGFDGINNIAGGHSGFTTTLTTPVETVSVGDVAFSLGLTAGAVGSWVGSSATSDFLNTLKFPTGIDVFNLPVGYTVNAGTYLVNNRFIDPNAPAAVPEPTTMLLLGLGLMGLAGVKRRLNK